jgi:hypothetical protein
MKRIVLLLLALLALLATGCDELDREGKLENGEFEYECGEPGDAACDGAETILGVDFDRDILPIAVDGTFNLRFDEGDTTIQPAAPDFVASEGGQVRILTATTMDFLAVDPDGVVRDFVDIGSVEPTGLQIFYDGEPVANITDPLGTIELAAAPMAGSEVLGGGFSYSWSYTGSVSLYGQDDGDNVVEASAYGAGTVTVTSNGMTTVVTFQ